MDEPFLPWWLALLLSMWTASIVLWQHPRVQGEVRIWSGVFVLVYLGLIFFALGCFAVTSRWMALLCVACSLIAVVWMMGQVSRNGRRLSYVLLTSTNAIFCASQESFEIAVGLLVVAAIAMSPLFKELTASRRLSKPDWLADLICFDTRSSQGAPDGEWMLTFGVIGIVVCLLIGTLGYALRVETARGAFGHSPSKLPTSEELDRIHADLGHTNRSEGVLDLATGARADVIVLLAAIVFVSLANSLGDGHGVTVSATDQTHFEPSGLNS